MVEVVAPTARSAEFDLIVDTTACYAEMGGQVGDTGLIHVPGPDWSEIGRLEITNTQKKGNVFIHRSALADGRAPEIGEAVRVSVDSVRRAAIQRHHTVTHLLHWALHEVIGKHALPKGISCRTGQVDLRLQPSAADGRAAWRRRKTSQRKDPGKRCGLLDGGALCRC